MATKLYKGSAGEDVKKLQKKLIEKGYDVGDTGADGIYGEKTEKAVGQYQKDAGLQVDGIAAETTLDSLYAAQPTAQVPVVAAAKTGAKDQSSAQVPTTEGSLDLPQLELPEYKPSYDGLLNSLQEQMQKGQNFSYRLEDDPLYHQYRQAYLKEGDLAARDSAARAAAATGGYGNSYAQSVSQQTLQGYLNKLYALTPELSANAYNRHQAQQDQLMEQYKLLQSAQDAEYSRYQDALQRYLQVQQEAYDRQQDALAWERQTQLDAYNQEKDAKEWERLLQLDAYNQQQDAKEWERQTQLDAYNQEQDAKEWERKLQLDAYSQEQDALDRQRQALLDAYNQAQDAKQWQRQLQLDAYNQQQDALDRQRQTQLDAYNQQQDALALEQKAQQEAYDRQQEQYKVLQTLIKAGYEASDAELTAVGMTRQQANALLPKTTTASSGSSGYDNGSYTEAQIKALQTFLGVTADGKFGSQSKAAMKEKGYASLDKAMEAMENRQGYFNYDEETHSQNNAKNNGQSMYASVLKRLKQMHASKEPLSKVADYLGQLVGDSYITRSEYLQLYNNYRDNSL